MERKAAQQNKNTSEEQKQGLPRHSEIKVRDCYSLYFSSKLAGNKKYYITGRANLIFCTVGLR